MHRQFLELVLKHFQSSLTHDGIGNQITIHKINNLYIDYLPNNIIFEFVYEFVKVYILYQNKFMLLRSCFISNNFTKFFHERPAAPSRPKLVYPLRIEIFSKFQFWRTIGTVMTQIKPSNNFFQCIN